MAGRNQVAEKQKNGAISAFFLALGLAAAIFVPLMIYNKGYFLYLGDFNVQQIPFYKLAHEAVRNGELFWNWKTDLGVNFIGSYSFYLLFSPFFWLTLPFSTEFVPHLMGPLLILKTACAALTAYLYIKRFIRDQGWAVIGSLLYAFSGFMTFNIFFNHFHEAAIFFPLLLVALEELVTNNRRGFFALMVAVNCLVNYWFFLGEVVFVVLYVLLRMITGGWGCTFGKFCAIALESVLGVAVAMVGLLPSVLALVGNPRTGGENLLTGWLMWIYGFNQRLPAIIQSFFFPPEMPSRPNFFPDMGAKWSSLSAWLPLFSATGVIAYCKSRRGDFHKRMIVLSMIMALVPVFNAAFVMFNNSYYARWFYMPILMMCVATASALENRPTMAEGWRSGWNWTFGFVAVISLAVGFSPVKGGDGALTFGLYDHPAGFWMLVAAALLCLLLSRILIFILHETRAFQKITCGMLSALIVVFTLGYLCAGKNTKSYDDWFIQTAIGGREQLRLPPEMETSNRNFVRSDLYDCMDNLGMFWGLPNIQAFHSIVPASLMEFYPSIGIKRDVSSKPPVSYVALRPLLSVRWLWISATAEEQHPMEGYSLVDTQMGYNLYENDRYIPMGFGYDTAVSDATAGQLGGEQRVRYMLSALLLDDEALERNSDILNEDLDVHYEKISTAGLEQAVQQRRQMAAERFETDRWGFSADCRASKPQLLFFSVPFDKGWSATVNGEPAQIERANGGFMAVRIPVGLSQVRFDYHTPGLRAGMLVSAGGCAVLAVYLLLCLLLRHRKKQGRRAAALPAPGSTGWPEAASAPDHGSSRFDETDLTLQTVDPPAPVAATPGSEKAVTPPPMQSASAPVVSLPTAPLRSLTLEEYLETLDQLPPIEADRDEDGGQV